MDPLPVVERVLLVLEEGRTAATYKHAVLLALLELCVEATDRHGDPPSMVTTRQLAEKVIALYWPHTRAWTTGTLLRQNGSVDAEVGSRTVLGLTHAARAALEREAGRSVPLVRARQLDPARWRRLVDAVERILVTMPLPKLQRVGGETRPLLYDIGWDDGARLPSLATLRRYQAGATEAFDNRVNLLEGVGETFARLHTLIRPFIQRRWLDKVASLNPADVPEAHLQAFLFGADRASLEPVRAGLVELQQGNCFYCRGRLRPGEVHVDHFLPWARHPDDGLANLVAADATCNGSKLDFLASAPHVERWRTRLVDARALHDLARAATWELGVERSLGAARALYLQLPPEARLWNGRGAWASPEPARLRAALG